MFISVFLLSDSISEMARGKLTKFVSGDDLEDDFMADDTQKNSEESNLKSKKKQGPKVVNFVG